MNTSPELSEKERARRRKKNLARKLSRQKAAAARALPPIMALSRAEYAGMFGADADYEYYADVLICGAKHGGRRIEFPLETLGGVAYPSIKPHRKGMPLVKR